MLFDPVLGLAEDFVVRSLVLAFCCSPGRTREQESGRRGTGFEKFTPVHDCRELPGPFRPNFLSPSHVELKPDNAFESIPGTLGGLVHGVTIAVKCFPLHFYGVGV
jgi:hypothetical protein